MSEKELTDMVRAVMRHREGWYEFVPRVKKVCKKLSRHGQLGLTVFAKHAVRLISDEKNLFAAMSHLYNHGGSAPGPDGLSLSAIEDKSERFAWARDLRERIREQSYAPGGFRVRKIPKASGKGMRRIAVQNLCDKVVQRGESQILGAIFDPMFVSHSYGYRPKRSREMALANAERITVDENRPVWVCEDIRDAFDKVPLMSIMELLESHLPEEALLQLLRLSIRFPKRKMGLLQGSPLSPLLLNLYLHHKVDLPFAKRCPCVPLFRWADDILLLCKNRRQAKKARSVLLRLIESAGMAFKDSAEPTIVDLRSGKRITWLGFDCGAESNTFDVRMTQRAVDRIKDTLREIAADDNVETVVCRKLIGWFHEAGPAYSGKSARGVVKQVTDELKQLGLARKRYTTERGTEVVLGRQRDWLKVWEEAHDKWFSQHMRRRRK